LYLSEAEERFSFWIFTARGDRLAYFAVSAKDACTEFALIRGALDYGVPFAQWRPYPIDDGHRAILRRLKLLAEYEQARPALGRVLYHARIQAYYPWPWKLATDLGLDPTQALKPMFAVRPRSLASIRRDVAEQEEVMKSAGLSS